MKNRDRQTCRLPWTAFTASQPEDLLAVNPDSFLTQSWANRWQHLEMSTFREGTEIEDLEEGLRWEDRWLPHALEFMFSSNPGEVVLHLDEVVMDIGTMILPLRRTVSDDVLKNFWPNRDHSVPGWTFGDFEGWKPELLGKKTEILGYGSSYGEGWELVFTDAGKEGSDSPILKIAPSIPIRIGTDRGVKRIHMSISSSGMDGYKLRLTFREEKLRIVSGNTSRLEERHEHFVTHLPLDFRGRRGFDIPLNYVGLPNRDNHRRHNKKIDGFLELQSLEIIRTSERDPKSSDRHRLVFWPVREWREKGEDPEVKAAHLSSKGEKTSFLSEPKARGVVLRDMESICWNQKTWKGEGSAHPILTLEEKSAFRGKYGLMVSIPRKEAGLSGRVEGKFFFNQTKVSPHDKKGLAEHQLEVDLRSSHRGKVGMILKDAEGALWSSPMVAIRESRGMDLPPLVRETIAFPPFKGKARHYRDEKGRRGSHAVFPLKLYGLHLILEGVKGEGRVDLDDLTLFGPHARVELRPFGLKRWGTTLPKEWCGGNLYESPWFSAKDGWYFRGQVEEPTDLIAARESLEKNYLEATKTYEKLRELDPASQKDFSDFFDQSSRIPQKGEEVKVNFVKVDEEGMTLDLKWQAQKEPKKWLDWGVQRIEVDRVVTSSRADRKIPLDRGVVGLELEWESSGFPDTFWELIFEDDEEQIYTHRISLEEKGNFGLGLGFGPHSFVIEDKKGNPCFPQIPSGNLMLKGSYVGMQTTGEKQMGEQTVRLRVPRFIVDREVEGSLIR